MTFASRMRQPAKLWHTIVAIAGGIPAVFGLLWAIATWLGMPAWGPSVAQAQLTARIDSSLKVQDSSLRAQALRDSGQDLVSMTIDARIDSVQTSSDATLRLVCTMTTPQQQFLAKVQRECRQ